MLETDEGQVSLEVSARPVDGLVEVTVEEARLPRPEDAPVTPWQRHAPECTLPAP
jgi:hypothetical protein